jgi:hypothetical protein
VVPEAPLEPTETGLVPAGEGWFVLNAQDARWFHADTRGAVLPFEGYTRFPQLGISLFVLDPGEPMGMYHWEADQEDFLVLASRPCRRDTLDRRGRRTAAPAVGFPTIYAAEAYAGLPAPEPMRYRDGWLDSS